MFDSPPPPPLRLPLPPPLPRSVAAISSANRVAEELNSTGKDIVGYQIRYDSQVTEHTRIRMMTEGILLREIQNVSHF